MPAEARMQALKTLIASGLTFSECVRAFGEDENDPHVAAALGKVREGELEVDVPAVVSRGADDGAYVMAWVWVSNEAAGVLQHSEVLETMLDHARSFLDGPHALDADTTKLRTVQADWLEELLSNYSDELDAIENEQIKRPPGSIAWMTESGEAVRFMPSDAISQLRLLARLGGLTDELANQAEQFCLRYGDKLDAVVAALPTA